MGGPKGGASKEAECPSAGDSRRLCMGTEAFEKGRKPTEGDSEGGLQAEVTVGAAS